MNSAENYIAINKALWNERTKHHVGSDFYNMQAFLDGETSLKDIELELFDRNIYGKKLLHLQCHFGQDTLSLSRMGAQVTGVDLSDEAIKKANEVATEMGQDAEFICCDLYDLPQHLDKQYDIVFTSYGTIGWLPDLDKWAAIISKYLKPGGSFVFAEFHPAVWMFDNDISYVQYSYFKADPIVETEQGTYGDKNAPMALESVGWNHSIGEVLGSLLNAGLELKQFKEYDYSPYDVFPGMVEIEKGKYQIEKMKGLLPLVYALKMVKP